MSLEDGEKKYSSEEEKAYEEANMLRAQLEISPETGKIPVDEWHDKIKRFIKAEGRTPTAEDYDRALAAIEEMKKIAAEEPTFERILNKLKDLPLKAAGGVKLAFLAMGVALETFSMAGVIDPGNKENEGIGEAMKRRWKRNVTEKESSDLGIFHSAENNLRALKASAEKYDKK